FPTIPFFSKPTIGLDLSFGGENGSRFLAALSTPLTAPVTLPIAPVIPLAMLPTMFAPALLKLPKKFVTVDNALLIPLENAALTPLNAPVAIPFNAFNIVVNIPFTAPKPLETFPPIQLNELENMFLTAAQAPLNKDFIIPANAFTAPIIFPTIHN